MVGQTPANTLLKLACVAATTSLFLICFFGEFMLVYLDYLTLNQISPYIFFFMFIILCGLALGNAIRVLTRDPGPVPDWLSVARVDQFVVGELERLAAGPRSAPTVAVENGDYEPAAQNAGGEDGSERQQQQQPQERRGTDASAASEPRVGRISFLEASDDDGDQRVDENVRANDALTQSLQARSAYDDTADFQEANEDEVLDLTAETAPTNAGYDAGGTSMENDGGYTAFTADHPDRMNERRQRKRRHGLRVRTVADVAYEALCCVRSGLSVNGTSADAASSDAAQPREPFVSLPASPASKDEQMQILLVGATRCRLCDCYKLQETHHCSRCGRCVHRMDHHCGWLGVCVGANNQKNFFLFLLNVSAACVLTTAVSFYLICIGRIVLVYETEMNTPLLLLFTFVTAFALVLPPFLMQSVYDLGRGESTLKSMKREERETVRRLARRTVESGTYAPVFQEEDDDAPQGFAWKNLEVAFGIGRVFPDWLLPSAPVRPPDAVTEQAFWDEISEMVSHQIYGIADSTGEGYVTAGRQSGGGRGRGAVAVPVHDGIDELFNVQIDLVEEDFRVPPTASNAPAAATAAAPVAPTGPPQASTVPADRAVGKIVSSGAATSATAASGTAVPVGIVQGADVAVPRVPKVHRKTD